MVAAAAAGPSIRRKCPLRSRSTQHEISNLMTTAATRVGVDVGGTFTDVVLHRADGRVAVRKLLSTPPSYDRAVVEAVGALTSGADVSEVIHGTTVATNAVLERRGSLTALVTT